MLDFMYSLVMEATETSEFFGLLPRSRRFYRRGEFSGGLPLNKAKRGMSEYVELLRENGLSVPAANPAPTVLVRNAAA